MKRYRIIYTLIMVIAMMVALQSMGSAQLILYDDFSEPLIDPSRWHGNESSATSSNPNAEAMRFIEDGALRLLLTSYGRVDRDGGRPFGAFGLGFANPDRITAMQADITVLQATAQACEANALPSLTRVRLFGFFFNDGSSLNPSDDTGNIQAGFEKIRSASSGDRIEAFVSRCTTPNCSPVEVLQSAVFETPVVIGQADTLRLAWEPEGDQFVFTVNPESPDEESIALSYAGVLINTGPPTFNQKRIRIANSTENCMAERRMTSMEVLIDNVLVNSSPPPPPICPSPGALPPTGAPSVGNLAFWLTAEDLADGPVASWTDRVCGVEFVQNDRLRQPFRGAFGLGSGVAFDGADDTMEAALAGEAVESFLASSEGTVVAIMNHPKGSQGYAFTTDQLRGAGMGFGSFPERNAGFFVQAGNDYVFGQSPINDANPHIAIVTGGNGPWEFFIDGGGPLPTGSLSGGNNGTWFGASGSYTRAILGWFDDCCHVGGMISELLFYNHRLSFAERLTIENYARDKYGVDLMNRVSASANASLRRLLKPKPGAGSAVPE